MTRPPKRLASSEGNPPIDGDVNVECFPHETREPLVLLPSPRAYPKWLSAWHARRVPVLDPLESIVAALVAIPSVSSPDPRFDQGNETVVARIADYAASLGAQVSVRPLAGAPGKANVVAVFGSGEGGLVLSGHTDTVPYDAGDWRSDPFTVTERDGALYGLGIADMKSFFACALHAIADVGVASLRAPVVLIGTADEESTMDGMRALAEQGDVPGEVAIIGEPTDLVPVRAHKGVLMERIALLGRAGHASDPSLGNSALDGMAKLLPDLVALREALARAHRDPLFAVDAPTLNLGRIAGGDSPNRICAHAEVDIDIRLLPGMVADEVRDRLREIAARVAEHTGLRYAMSSITRGLPAFSCAEDAGIVRLAEALTGVPATAVPFGTEAPFLSALGKHTIVLGPGSIKVAHQPDEHVHRADLLRGRALYAKLVHATCVAPEV